MVRESYIRRFVDSYIRIIERFEDKEEILAFLQQDRLYAAYAIGDLEPSLFAQCQWFGAEQDGRMQALALFFTGLQPPALFTMGDTDGVAAILDSALQPKRAYFMSRVEHLTVLEAYYDLAQVQHMLRMVIAAADFRPVLSSPNGPVPGPVIRLDSAHLDQLIALYRREEDSAFAPYQLRDGVFYGIEVSRQLVSAAGTHLVSPTFGVAAVGNIFTHPNYRRRGYGTACTSHVVEKLLTQGFDVVLNVNETNAKAIRIYEKLGFRTHCPFIEVLGHRK